MYEQKRTEVNKSAEKFEKEMRAAKRSGNKANQVRAPISRSTAHTSPARPAARPTCPPKLGLVLYELPLPWNCLYLASRNAPYRGGPA